MFCMTHIKILILILKKITLAIYTLVECIINRLTETRKLESQIILKQREF